MANVCSNEIIKLFQEMKFIILILCFVGETSGQIEEFSEHECKFGNEDLTLWGLSYVQCLQECRARAMCASINVNPYMRECRLHFNKTAELLPCSPYLFSEKSNWEKKRLCNEDDRCQMQPNVKLNSDCECKINECPPAVIPNNAIILGNGRLIGHRIVYACINELNITTEYHQRNCSEPGVWSGEPVKCPDMIPPSLGPGEDPISIIEPPTTTTSTTGSTSTTSTTATTAAETTTLVVGDQVTIQTQPQTSFQPTTAGPENPVNPFPSPATGPPSTSPPVTSTSTTTTATSTTTTQKNTKTPTQPEPTDPKSTTSSTTTTTTPPEPTNLWTTTSTTAGPSTIYLPWFFDTYNMTCRQEAPDMCDAMFDLECRLERCQCAPPSVLDFSGEMCTTACPALPDDESMYGDTYQEFDHFDIRTSGEFKQDSIYWPISFGPNFDTAKELMLEYVYECTMDDECRAVHGYAVHDSLNITLYYGTGQIQVFPTTIFTDFMRLYVRDCAIRNITDSTIST